MALYFAPAFFAHLLGKCMQKKSLTAKLGSVAKLGMVVILTFTLIWLPFLRSPTLAVQVCNPVTDTALQRSVHKADNSTHNLKQCFDVAGMQVLQRLAPVQRGLFEDYVANFWCVTHVVLKWKALFSKSQLWRMCTGATMLAFLPCTVQQIRNPSRHGFVLCLANSAFAFFIFSYQVWFPDDRVHLQHRPAVYACLGMCVATELHLAILCRWRKLMPPFVDLMPAGA